MAPKNETDPRILTLRKTFNAPIDLVWEAWTEPEHIAQWWGPTGMEVKVISHDFAVGGKWQYVMPMPNGSEFISEGEYIEITAPTKLVTTANFKPMTEGVEITIVLEAKGDQTEFIFSVLHPTEEYKKQQEQMGFYNGWGSTFERLEAYLSTISN